MGTSPAIEEPVEHELDSNVERDLAKHAGKWVALTRSEIVAVGDSVEEVLETAAARHIASPILMRVPDSRPPAHYY